MRVVFHPLLHASDYSDDPYDNAADPGRLEGIMKALQEEGGYAVDTPMAADRSDLLRGHAPEYVDAVASRPRLFPVASMAAGAAMTAADLAMRGEPAFACVRPPGHHASRGAAWGHCTFSNVALALLRLRAERRIESALVVDFDLHTGDGTANVLGGWPQASVCNPYGDTAFAYLEDLKARLRRAPPVDILAVSAGFDAYLHDLGRKLGTEDYFHIGTALKEHAIRACGGRRFAVLEGGYYLPDLGRNVLAFCRGFE